MGATHAERAGPCGEQGDDEATALQARGPYSKSYCTDLRCVSGSTYVYSLRDRKWIRSDHAPAEYSYHVAGLFCCYADIYCVTELNSPFCTALPHFSPELH